MRTIRTSSSSSASSSSSVIFLLLAILLIRMAESVTPPAVDSSKAAVHIVYTERPQDEEPEAYHIRTLASVLGRYLLNPSIYKFIDLVIKLSIFVMCILNCVVFTFFYNWIEVMKLQRRLWCTATRPLRVVSLLG